MKRPKQEKKHRSGTIPVDSFSDIAFLLIIYFMVATTLIKVKSITADMPAGEKSTQAQPDKTPIINLRGAEMFFNDKPVNMTELNERLAALELAQQQGQKRIILLESTKGTPYENYFRALAAISANGGIVAPVEEE
ncbi:MAG: Biopolymer transport protein ExbD/TolR [Verrucomicrobiota bacterium]|jgi:biopolymer transport protein ExbD